MARFPEPLATAHREWLAERPLQNPAAPQTPFAMPSYKLPERAQATAADQRADVRFHQTLTDSQRGDDYTLLTVLFATVLFFAAMSQRLPSARSQWALLAMAIVPFLGGVAFLATLPKLF